MSKRLYESVDELIAPETLCRWVGSQVTAVQTTPLAGDNSGSQLVQLTTDGEQPGRFVLKQMSARFDWLMQSSNDQHCRSVALWQHGLLDQLQPAIDHAIFACARRGDDWFILMRDVSPHLMSSRTGQPAEIKFFLTALADLHATFWNSPALAEPSLGLCDSRSMIETLSVGNARRIPSEISAIPHIVIEGWDLLQAWLEPDVSRLLTDLLADPTPLCNALANYPKTLVHGDYRPANQALDSDAGGPVILLDWQMAGYALPTLDLSWFLNNPKILSSSMNVDVGVADYRQRLEDRLGEKFPSVKWHAMRDLGELVDILRISTFKAWFAVNSPDKQHQAIEASLLSKINEVVRRGQQWL